MSGKPFRLALAQKVCRPLPPLISQRIRAFIYPQKRAFRDDYEFQVRALTGSWFRHRTSDFHGYPFSVHGYYEWRNWAIALAVCSPGDRIIEIGANIGTETVGFADIVGRKGCVYAFEPFSDNVKALQTNVALNNLKQVTVFALAVGALDGRVRFVTPPDEHASGVGFVAPTETGKHEPAIEVEAVTLDSFRQELGPCQAIFVDVEGAEVDVLRGGRSYITEFEPVVVLEASPRLLKRSGLDLHNLHQEVTSLGYKAYHIGRYGIRDISLSTNRAANWLCLPSSQQDAVASINWLIRRSGFLPCIAGLNPMVLRG